MYENNDDHPPSNIDIYQSKNKFVWVKFDDFTFNPKFVIYYEYPETAVPSRDLPAITNKSSKRYGYSDRTELPKYTVLSWRHSTSTPAIKYTAAKRNEVRFVAGSGHPQTRPESLKAKEYDDGPVLFLLLLIFLVGLMSHFVSMHSK